MRCQALSLICKTKVVLYSLSAPRGVRGVLAEPFHGALVRACEIGMSKLPKSMGQLVCVCLKMTSNGLR